MDFTYRLHWWLRWWSFPFTAVLRFVPKTGTVVDFGCGFGILSWLLAQKSSRLIMGIDISTTKLDVARRWLRNYKNISFSKALPEKKVDTVVILDVLYLMTDDERRKVIKKLSKKLKPGGKLLVSFVPRENSWRYYLSWAQEWLMVKTFKKTQGGLVNFETVAGLKAIIKQCGFRQLRLVSLPTMWPWWHKHLLAIATR